MFHKNDFAEEGGWPEHYAEDLARFMENDPNRPVGLDLYEDVFNSALFPLQRKRELVKMIQLARTLNPRVVGEIGSDKGGSFYHWCKCFPTVQRAYACEYRGVPFQAAFEQAFPQIDFGFVYGSSFNDDNVSAVKDWLSGDKFDCLFLDGEKCFFDKDFYAYEPLVRSGGIIFLHDIHGFDINPRHTLDALKDSGYDVSEIIDVSEYFDDDRTCDSAWHQWLRYWKTTSCGVGVVRIP